MKHVVDTCLRYPWSLLAVILAMRTAKTSICDTKRSIFDRGVLYLANWIPIHGRRRESIPTVRNILSRNRLIHPSIARGGRLSIVVYIQLSFLSMRISFDHRFCRSSEGSYACLPWPVVGCAGLCILAMLLLHTKHLMYLLLWVRSGEFCRELVHFDFASDVYTKLTCHLPFEEQDAMSCSSVRGVLNICREGAVRKHTFSAL
jgi:hypothetical protein